MRPTGRIFLSKGSAEKMRSGAYFLGSFRYILIIMVFVVAMAVGVGCEKTTIKKQEAGVLASDTAWVPGTVQCVRCIPCE
jgi:hypothetical protein